VVIGIVELLETIFHAVLLRKGHLMGVKQISAANEAVLSDLHVGLAYFIKD
jgi:hypothetical protein